MERKTLGLYGYVKLIREKTEDGWQVRPIGKNEDIDGLPIKRMSGSPGVRKRPSSRQRAFLLDKFYDSCAYCTRRFGSYVEMDNKRHLVRVQWDHIIPYVYAQDNSDINFLPACQFCNHWKSDLMFKTIDAVRFYVEEIWAKKLSSGL